MAPMQVVVADIPVGAVVSHTGWLLLVHPDLLWNTNLAKKIRQYGYFSYKANEALRLSSRKKK